VPVLNLSLADSTLFGNLAVANSYTAHSVNTSFYLGLLFFFMAVCSTILILFFGVEVLKNKIPFLKKSKTIQIWLDNLSQATQVLKAESVLFWIKLLGIALLMWTMKYLVLIALMQPFLSLQNTIIVYARQWVQLIMMMTIPSPGGMGTAEYTFEALFSSFLPNVNTQNTVLFFWRLATYYYYILAGFCLIPFISRLSKKQVI
jgi:uncharacterized membrane protein YbhN (UPF0104 family)